MASFKNEFNGVSVYMSERSDAYGNPRCIVHFRDFLRENEDIWDTFGGVCECYDAMRKRANKAGFRAYHAKEFGGGFICQYDYCGGKEVAERVIKARNY